MGGFVSSLRRLQSSKTDGDSLYNLSLLFYGSKSGITAPITGAIFAILLYLMFSSGMLSGTFFPTIYTPEGTFTEAPALPGLANGAENGVQPNPDSTANSTTKAKPTPTPKP